MMREITKNNKKSIKIPLIGLATFIVFLMLAVATFVPVRADDPVDDGSGTVFSVAAASLQQSTAESVVVGEGIVSYAAWNDDDDRDFGFVYIYPLQDNTNIELWANSSVSTPIQINTLVAS